MSDVSLDDIQVFPNCIAVVIDTVWKCAVTLRKTVWLFVSLDIQMFQNCITVVMLYGNVQLC
jgi:hypothetical protein